MTDAELKTRSKESAAGRLSSVTLMVALVLVALVPTVGVLWFMTLAMRNERLAVQERLAGIYLNHLTSLQRQVTSFWQVRQAALAAAARGSPTEVFAAVVRAKLADSVVVCDGAGNALYPTIVNLEVRPGEDGASARALQAQASGLLKTGQKEQALAKLAELTGDARLSATIGAQGTLIVPNAQLLILKLLGETQVSGSSAVLQPASGEPGRRAEAAPYFQELRQRTLDDLVRRLNDYAEPGLGSGQRRFLMREVRALAPEAGVFPTFEAERLAAEYLEHAPADALAGAVDDSRGSAIRPGSSPVGPAITPKFQRASVAKVWRLSSADGTVAALFREERLRAELAATLGTPALPDARVTLLAPDETAAADKRLPLLNAGELLPGWRLALNFNGADPWASASARQSRFYLWMGVGVVAIIAVLALMVARYVAAQMRLARLKNELVSTVSHELKTPLASMRALVDTLAAGRFRDERQLQDYLRLIVKENVRLSHVIENFLAFSRMERGQQRFHFEALAPAEVVRAAAEALQEKLNAPGCRLEIAVPPDLPRVRGDAEALATVLINLLDNACKYTNGEKRIAVRALAEGGAVQFEVEDNGIGLAPEETRRIFDRFYQVDQSLTRQRGGCGLGLSIVRFIVEAHRGAVDVKSEPGKGSVFRVRIPAAGESMPRS